MASSIIILLLILTAFQCGAFAAFLLVTGRWRRVSNASLAALLAMLSIQMGTVAAQWYGLLSEGEKLSYQFGLLYGPLFYVYVLGLLYENPGFGWRSSLHLLPFLAASAWWYMMGATWRSHMPVVILSLGFYLGACFAIVRRYQRVVEGTRSEFNGLTLRWLRFIVGLWACVFTLYSALYASLFLDGRGTAYFFFSITLYAALLAFTSSLVFAALEHPKLFKPVSPEETALVLKAAGTETEPSDDDRSLAKRIAALMNEDKLYLQPELSLSELAMRLGVPARRASEAINRCFGQNFSDYVNSYRIEAAKNRLTDPAAVDESILEILHATGFSSKSVFNAAFKLKTGLSPTQYRLQQPKEKTLAS